MKKTAIPVLICVFTFLFMHMVFAYSYWDLNPKNWDAPSRAFSMFLSIIFSSGICSFYKEVVVE